MGWFWLLYSGRHPCVAEVLRAALPIYVMSSCYQHLYFLGPLCAQTINAILVGWWREENYNSKECFLKPDPLLCFGSRQAVLPSPHLRLS